MFLIFIVTFAAGIKNIYYGSYYATWRYQQRWISADFYQYSGQEVQDSH